jgi:hypothetical protein
MADSPRDAADDLDDIPLDPQDNPDGDPVADLEDEPGDPADEPDEPSDPSDADAAAAAPGQPQQPSRRDRRIETLTTSLAEERRHREELNRRLDALLSGQVQRPQPGESPETRAQRLALLTPEERMREDLQVATQGFAREMAATRFQTQDGNDRAAFEAKALVDPLFKKWAPRVETELQTLRQQNQNVEREKLMYYLIGKNAVENRSGAARQQRAAAQQRVRSQTTRPSNSGSDVAANRRSDRNASLERRLENQQL